MNIIPIGIGLLFDEKTNQWCKKLNKNLQGIDFNLSLPHISLAQFIIKEEDLEKVLDELKFNFERDYKFSLEIESLKNGSLMSSIIIRKNLNLINFQKRVFEIFEKYNIEEQLHKEDFLLDKDEIFDNSTIDWIKNFKENNLNQDSNFHITLGKGSLESLNSEFDNILIQNIIISHLGNYCTYKKILESVKLK